MTKEQLTARLVRGIVAFDAIIQDILMDVENGNEPHDVALNILDALAAQLLHTPEISASQGEFIKEMADLGGRIRLHILCIEPDDKNLEYGVKRIRERLQELGPRNVFSMAPVDKHSMN